MKKLVSIYIFFSILSSQDYSVRFDGVNDYAYVLDHPDLDLTSNYTLEAWIFPESFSWLSGIISKYHTNGSNGYTLRLNQDSPYTGLGFDELETNNSVLDVNQWYHIAAVKSSNGRRLYVNGLEVNLSGNPLNVNSNNDPIRIGSDFGGRFFQGRIDEVRIWNISRSEIEINTNMEGSLTGNEEGLIAYYNFNEGIDNTLNDLTGNEHTGVLVGNPLWTDGISVNGSLGDINYDETLNIYDAVQLVAIYLDNSLGNDQQLILCDTNQDDIIDIDDIVLLISWILGIDNSHLNGINNLSFFQESNSLIINPGENIAAIEIKFEEKVENNNNFNIPSGWIYKIKNDRLILFSIDGSSFPKDYKINLKGKTSIKSIKASDWSGNKQFKTKNSSNISQFKIYPNPFNSSFKVNINSLFNEVISLKIYDINGRFIKELYNGISKNEYNFDLNNYDISSGLYYVSLISSTKVLNKKVVYLK
tara:strand:- start:2075 stop:3499 length:1425 start_codon:yes stop_codon:yes gene_type:complete